MRIVAGEHRSRLLESPKDDAIRPTSDKIRGALFNMLQSRGLVEDAVVIDAFCGTGALGLEALSQGAAFCTFIDKHKPSLELARRNIASLKEEGRSKILLADATRMAARPDTTPPATLVFLDPPYGKGLIVPAIAAFDTNGWLDRNAVIVLEAAASETDWNDLSAEYALLLERRYGETMIRLVQRQSA